MKIIVLHGEDTEKSSERLKKFIQTAKSRSWEVSYLDESNQKFQDDVSSTSLFGNERFFILTDIKKLGSAELGWLKKKYAGLAGTFIIYHEGLIGQSILKSLPDDTKVEEFKLPKLIWSFLDRIFPGNSAGVVKEFHQVIRKDFPEFVFSLIAKLFRDLYWLKVGEKSLPYPLWRKSRLKIQSEKFKIEEIKEIIGKLSEIDILVKTGKSDLVSSLDLFFIKYLQ